MKIVSPSLLLAAIFTLAQPGPLHAQVRGMDHLQIGATVAIDTRDDDYEGVVVGLDRRSISLLLEDGDSDADTVSVPRRTVVSMRIKDSGALWSRHVQAKRWSYSSMEAAVTGEPSDPLAVLESDDRLVALDASTGRLRWEIEKSEDAEVGLRSTSYPGLGLLVDDAGLDGLDLSTGKVLWQQRGLPDQLQASLHLSDTLMAQIRTDGEGQVRVLALDPMTGREIWESTGLTTHPLEEQSDQQFLRLGDTNHLVAYVSRDGPFLLDVETGELLWRSIALRGRPVPSRGQGSAALTADDSLVYVPTERGVAALDRFSGERRWEFWDDETLSPALLIAMPQGVLVYGRKISDGMIKDTQFYLLDRASGQQLWNVGGVGSGLVFTRFDSIFVGLPNKVMALDLETGSLGEVAQFKFWAGSLRHFDVDADGYHFGWAFGASALNRDGAKRFQVYLEPPGATFSESGRPSRPAGLGDSKYWYAFTEEPLEDGAPGFSIARIDMESGEVDGRVYLDERNPEYLVSTASHLVLVRKKDHVAAYAFPGCQALEYAAARGDTALLNLLAGKGIYATSAADGQCHPLRAAARYDREPAVQLLLDAGWLAESPPTNWTALHYAAVYGHLGVVQMLLSAGMRRSIETAGPYPWTPLLLALRWGHEEVAAELDAAGASASLASRRLAESMWMAQDGMLEEAMEARRETAEVSPDEVLPPHYRSLFCYRRALAGQPEEALVDCDAGVSADPEDTYAYFARAITRGLMEDYDGAASDLRTLVRLDPFHANTRTYLKLTYEFEAGRQPLTEEFLEELKEPEVRQREP